MAPTKRKAVTEERPSKKAKPAARSDATKHDKDAENSAKSTKSPKPTKSSGTGDAPPRSQVKSVLVQEERAFPRGGGSLLTPLEHKQIRAEAERDVLLEQENGQINVDEHDDDLFDAKSKSSSVKKKRKTDRHNAGQDQKSEKAGFRIQSLSYKTLAIGSAVLGRVTAITSRDVAVALANNLTGYVPFTAVSARLNERIEKLIGVGGEATEEEEDHSDDDNDIDLKKLFYVGQWLRAVVTASGKDAGETNKSKRHIELTLDPSKVNGFSDSDNVVVNSMVQASVRSVEDHGVVMDLGFANDDVKGFIGKKDLVGVHEIDDVQDGQVFLCLVTGKGSNGKVLKLSPNPNHFSVAGVGNKLQTVTDAPTVDGFQPGTAVEILVTESGPRGVVGKIMGMIDVSADAIQSGVFDESQDLNKKYKVGSKTKARIIWTLPKDDDAKWVGVSLLDHVLTMTPPTSKLIVSPLAKIKSQAAELDQKLALSTIVEDAKVVKVSSERGLYVSLPSPSGAAQDVVRAFAHISQLSDKRIDSILSTSGDYKIDSAHRVRVLAYNPVDNFYYVSMKPSILEQTFLRLEDLAVGEVVKGSVEKLILGGASGVVGVLVNISDHISGLIPEMHFSDTQLSHPERKFREGFPIRARVLSVDFEKRQLRLTAKKSLVDAEDTNSIWKNYDDLVPGMEAQGTVLKLTTKGAVMQFYGPVRGFLPVAEMSESYIEQPETHFRIGQTVRVRILNVNSETQQMRLSCKDDHTLSTKQRSAWESVAPGQIVTGTVSETTADDVRVALENGLLGTIKVGHLVDGSPAKAESALKRIRLGQKMSDVLVLSKNIRSQTLVLSNKSHLIEAAKLGTLITSIGDIVAGRKYHGFIRNITPEGIYVEFAANLVGLLPKGQLLPEMLSEPAFGLRKDQTLHTWVIFVDVDRQRFSLSLREPKDRPGNDSSKAADTNHSEAVQNPVDPTITSTADFTIGKITKARISAIKSTQLQVLLADGVQGRVDISEAFDTWDEIANKKAPLQKFRRNEVIEVKVLGIYDARSHRFLPISHRHGKHPVFELSAKPSRINDNDESLLTIDTVKEGSTYPAFINNHGHNMVWVHLSPNVKAPMSLMELSDDVGQLQHPSKYFPVGSAVHVRVKVIDQEAGRLELSAKADRDGPLTLKDVSPGMILPAKVIKVTERSINVLLSEDLMGPVTLTEIADDYDKIDLAQYNKNDIVRVCVVDVDLPNKKLFLSLRPSKVLSSSLPVKDAHIANASQLKEGLIVRGFVKRVADKGVFVSLGATVDALVWISDLSDEYVKDWKSLVEIDQLVKGRIISLDNTGKFIQMTLKPSQVDGNYVPPLKITTLEVGAVVTGKVRKVEDFGAFIDIDNTQPKLSGLCHRSEMAEKPIEDARKIYSSGDVVKAKILKVDVSKRKINLGLKASYFGDEADNEDGAGEQESEDDAELSGGVDLDEGGIDSEDDGGIDVDGIEDVENGVEDDSDAMDVDDPVAPAPTKGLRTSGFNWAANLDSETNGAMSESEAEDTKPKKRKKTKPEIKVDLTGDLDKYGPRSVSDFERQLLGQPNNSGLWVQYMAFQLELSEVQKARDIAERALRTIHIRETEEKLNVWIAWLNLEVAFGDDESVESVFKEACQVQDSLEIHQKLASIYIDSGKLEKADDVFRRIIAVKAFRASSDVWLNYATFLMNNLDAPDRARALLTQSHQSIPASEQRSLTAKFAALEFHSEKGDAERGRTIFEGLITEWPKWSSGWDTWVDLERSRISRLETDEAKKEARDRARALFERMAAQKMKKRRAHYVYKRWLEFEESEGTAKTAERVKALAAEYVQKLQSGGDDMEE